MSAAKISVCIFALVCSSAAFAIDVSGPISVSTTWSVAQSPYRVTADVSIEGGATLIIEPGVTVYLDLGTNLSVNSGALQARGTAALPIIFTASSDTPSGSPAPGNWGVLRFRDGTNDALTVLEHAEVRFGQGVVVESASPTLTQVFFKNNSGPAISVDLNSSPRGIGLQASGNGVNGVAVPAGEIFGSIVWGLQGIPYVVAQGILSVGQAPTITGIIPNQIQQGEVIAATVSGTRLDGADRVTFDSSVITATILPGGTSTTIPVQLAASAAAPLGALGFEAQVAAGRARRDAAVAVVQIQPQLISVTPSIIYLTQSDRTITVSGRNFLPESKVMWTDVLFPTTYVSDTTLTAVVPGLGVGVKNIVVVTPDPRNAGQTFTSNSIPLTIAQASLTFAPATLAFTQGTSASLILSMPHVAPAGGQSIALSSSSSNVTVPPSVTIPAGTRSVAVPVTGVTPGSATVTASRVNFTSGSASVSVVLPPAEEVTQIHSTPNPLAVPPDGIARQFFVRIPAATVSRNISLAVVDASIATISPTTIALAAGETQAAANITGRTAGQTTIRVIVDGVADPVEIPVYVTTDFAKMDFTYGRPVGIVRGDGTAPAVSAPGNPTASIVVGIVKGDTTLPASSAAGNPVVGRPLGISKGDPTLPSASASGNPTSSVVVGIVKGDSTAPLNATPAGLTASTVMGVVKGSADLPIVPTAAGPVVSPVVGVQK